MAVVAMDARRNKQLNAQQRREATLTKYYVLMLWCQSQLVLGYSLYRLVQKKDTVLLSTSLAWPAVAGCSRAETFSQLSAFSFAQPCTCSYVLPLLPLVALEGLALEARLQKYSGMYIYR